MKEARVRNIEYALTGSVDGEESGKRFTDKYRLEPNVWTKVSDAVYESLKNKFGNSKYSDAPNALPGAGDTYYGSPGQTRSELVNGQYLIEFRG